MLKRALKMAAGALYLRSGSGKQALADRAVILMLHRVVESDEAASLPHRNELCVGQHSFDRLLGWLKRHFDICELEPLLTTPSSSDRPRLALTFDDGWHDNATLAFPILQRHQVPASIFLSTDFIGTRQGFWWESIGETLWGSFGLAAIDSLLPRLAASGKPVPELLRSMPQNADRSRLVMRYLASLKDLPAPTLQALADSCPLSDPPQAMSWAQVTELEQSGLIRFGAHGASHALLDCLSPSQLQQDISRSLAAIASHCEQPLPIYCYPNGNYSASVTACIQQHALPFALSTRAGIYSAQSSMPYGLPRIGISQAVAAAPALLGWRIQQAGRPHH
ncbi:polysaccharide deacetylase [Pokkaliibacter plantistimulans]|uniref:Polysaccharide deacetylase n=1 Tax=Pokkaliibacter plantistimulans TaxID=1635171 RepID=A0ABX5M1S3_9GAMM|nr:polysaccharide deacetylase family protein [Pokkaliibacter plantistimulans]PXF32875.1 polysaccharide deacetylase [Pokkaliibacter plantistimulans]